MVEPDTGAFAGQGADNKPHLMYFHHETRIGFVWDGDDTHIQVNQGGVGEPQVTVIRAPRSEGKFPSLRRGIELFKYAGDLYVAEVLANLEHVPQTEDKNRPGEFSWSDDEVERAMPK
jgi:hypothetical protein